MYPILQKQILSPTVKLVVVRAPLVAGKAKAGQFVIVRMDERGERIPLTIADFDFDCREHHLDLPGSWQVHHANGDFGSGRRFLECGRPVRTSDGNRELWNGGGGRRRRGYCAPLPDYARFETGRE